MTMINQLLRQSKLSSRIGKASTSRQLSTEVVSKNFSTFSKSDPPRSAQPGDSNSVRITFLRHGQSTWNQQNIFIGMTDTPLTEDGTLEAMTAGKLLLQEEMKFDVVYTSLLRRSIKTVWMVMQELELEWIDVIKDWRLNERSYGALVGLNKKKCVEEYGKDQVKRWRRSWDEPPPPMTKSSKYWPGKDERYTQLGIVDKLPLSESLKDVTVRTTEFWDEIIVPQLKLKKRILIVGHENNLRSIIKRLDDISETDILELELPRAIPLIYELDINTLKPIKGKKKDNKHIYLDEVIDIDDDDDVYEGVGVPVDIISGRYICDPKQLKSIAKKDQQQVYDLRYKQSLETAPYLGVNPIKANDILITNDAGTLNKILVHKQKV